MAVAAVVSVAGSVADAVAVVAVDVDVVAVVSVDVDDGGGAVGVEVDGGGVDDAAVEDSGIDDDAGAPESVGELVAVCVIAVVGDELVDRAARVAGLGFDSPSGGPGSAGGTDRGGRAGDDVFGTGTTSPAPSAYALASDSTVET